MSRRKPVLSEVEGLDMTKRGGGQPITYYYPSLPIAALIIPAAELLRGSRNCAISGLARPAYKIHRSVSAKKLSAISA